MVAALLIAASLAALGNERARAVALRDQWGPTTAAWVTVDDLDAGHLLVDGDVTPVRLPPSAVPADAATDSPLGHRLADPMGEGEIVRLGRLRGGEESVTSSRVGPTRGAVALSVAAPHLEVGDRVDLYALLDGATVATDGEVVSMVDGVPVVAVERSELAAVIQAFSLGDVVPVLVG